MVYSYFKQYFSIAFAFALSVQSDADKIPEVAAD